MFDKLEFCCFYSEVRVLANSQTLQTRELCHMKPTGELFVQLNFDHVNCILFISGR